MNRRDLIKSAVATALTVGLTPASALIGIRGGASAAAKRYLGVNLSGIKYYGPEQPFLNILKQADPQWWIQGTVRNPYIQLDADGNVTSMKGSDGTTFTQIFTFINYNLNGGTAPPGASALYPTGTYRLVFSGPGTFFVGNDMSIRAGDNPSPPAGVTITGNSVTSTLAMEVSASITVYVGTATGAGVQIGDSSLANDNSNYVKFISLVQSSLTSSYDGGEIFHPNFLAQLAPYSRIRFMDWQATNFQEQGYNFTADLATSATSGKLASSIFKGYISGTTLTVTSWISGQYTSLNGLALDGPGVTAGTTVTGGSGSSWTVNNSQTVGSSGSPVQMATELPWANPTGTYTFVFASGQVVSNVSLTYGSSAASWTTALTGTISSSTIYGWMSSLVYHPTWASRPKMSRFSWANSGTIGGGVPYEVQALLCNRLGVDGWFCVPMGANYADSSYASNLAALLNNGAGASLAGPVSSFSGLNSSKKAYVELSNEVWNGGFGAGQNGFSLMVGQQWIGKATGNYNQFYAAQEQYGIWVAGVADAFYTAYGSSAFASRVVVSMGAQTASGTGAGFLVAAMNTVDWTSAAYTHHIGAIHYAPYFWLLAGVNSTDMATIAALADPVGETFSLAYTNHGASGNTYASIPTEGYVRGATTSVTAVASLISAVRANGYEWANLPVLGYEMGEDSVLSTYGFTITTTIANVFKDSYRDSRMQYLYHDPGHVLSSNSGYLDDLITIAGMQSFNIFNDCESASNNSYWAQDGDQGQLENVMQAISPLSSAPGKYQGVAKYAAGL